MSKHFSSFFEVVSSLDNLAIGEKIKVDGKPAIIVEAGRNGKIVRFTAIRMPERKWQPAAMRRAH